MPPQSPEPWKSYPRWLVSASSPDPDRMLTYLRRAPFRNIAAPNAIEAAELYRVANPDWVPITYPFGPRPWEIIVWAEGSCKETDAPVYVLRYDPATGYTTTTETQAKETQLDPQATIAIILDDDASATDRLEAADNLRDWIDNGGFYPLKPVVDAATTAAELRADPRPHHTDHPDVTEETYDHHELTVYEIDGNSEWQGTWARADDEIQAREAAKDAIRESVWAFQPEFLASHMPDGITVTDVETLRGDRCDSVNDAFLALIEAGSGFDDFADEAIGCDGLGHFLSPYDGEEHEAADGSLWFRLD